METKTEMFVLHCEGQKLVFDNQGELDEFIRDHVQLESDYKVTKEFFSDDELEDIYEFDGF